MSEPIRQTFSVIRHKTIESQDKETIYTVVLKTTPTATMKATLEIQSEMDSIRATFPLNETFEVSFTNPQTRLGEEESA